MRIKGHFYRLNQSATTPVLDQHLDLYPLFFYCLSPMRNFGAAGPVLKSAPLLATPRTAPFGRVRRDDAHDAPLSDEFGHLICPPGGRGSARVVWGIPSRLFRMRRTKPDASTLPRRRTENGGCGRKGGKGRSGCGTRSLPSFVVVSWICQNAERLRDIYA
jgi:hypothetical protein